LVRSDVDDVNEQRGKMNAALSCEVGNQKSGKNGAFDVENGYHESGKWRRKRAMSRKGEGRSRLTRSNLALLMSTDSGR